jgi:hypothetical protein
MFTLFGAKCRIVKIYLEDIYDIFFYHKWFVYISINNILFNRKNVFFKIPTKHDSFRDACILENAFC